MQCLTPIHVPNNKDPAGSYMTVPCGKCEACVTNKAAQWYVRLKNQIRDSDNSVFVTLTYADQHLPAPRIGDDGMYHYDVSRDDIQHYHYRLRKALGSRSKKLKYFLVSEYGPNPENGWLFRPHYHAIYMNLYPSDYYLLERAWHKGFTEFGEITDNRVRYVTGYSIEKLFVPPGAAPSFSLISNGIGLGYVDRMKDYHKDQLDRVFAYVDGSRLPLPRYLKDRLYTETQKAAFAKLCQCRSEEKFDQDLKSFNGDLERLFDHYHDVRSDFVRKKRLNHKKRKN